MLLCGKSWLTFTCARFDQSVNPVPTVGSAGIRAQTPQKQLMSVFHLYQSHFWVADVFCSYFHSADASFASPASVSCALLAFCVFFSTVLSKSFTAASDSAYSSVHLDDRPPDSRTLKWRFLNHVCGFCLHSKSEILPKVRTESEDTPS